MKVTKLKDWKAKQSKRALEKRIYASRVRRLGLTIAQENRLLSAWKPSR